MRDLQTCTAFSINCMLVFFNLIVRINKYTNSNSSHKTSGIARATLISEVSHACVVDKILAWINEQEHCTYLVMTMKQYSQKRFQKMDNHNTNNLFNFGDKRRRKRQKYTKEVGCVVVKPFLIWFFATTNSWKRDMAFVKIMDSFTSNIVFRHETRIPCALESHAKKNPFSSTS